MSPESVMTAVTIIISTVVIGLNTPWLFRKLGESTGRERWGFLALSIVAVLVLVLATGLLATALYFAFYYHG